MEEWQIIIFLIPVILNEKTYGSFTKTVTVISGSDYVINPTIAPSSSRRSETTLGVGCNS